MRKHDSKWTHEIRPPVAHDLFVYARSEWEMLAQNSARFHEMLRNEAVWFVVRPPTGEL